jgi:TPR repeat protein
MRKHDSKIATSAAGKAVDAAAVSELADAAWKKGRNKEALALFLKAAQLGEPSAQHNVGYFYDIGIGTKKDFQKARLWYLKAWRTHGQTDTCINIAQLYSARGKTRSAMRWWKEAVRRGDGDAALDLARIYLARTSRRERQRGYSLLRKVLKSRRVTEDAVKAATKLLGAKR